MSKENRRAWGEGGVYQRKDGKWVAAIDLGQGDDGKHQRHVTLITGQGESALIQRWSDQDLRR